GARRHHGLVRAAGSDGHVRPHRGDARGPHGWHLRSRRAHRRNAGRRRDRQRRRRGRVMKINRDLLLAVIVLVMTVAVGFVTPAFVPPDPLAILFNDPAILIMMALGQMTVILTKCIDLSVAANVAFTGVVVALINVAYPGLPIPIIMLIAALMGLLL